MQRANSAADADVESDADSLIATATADDAATEAAPLLASELPTDLVPDKAFRRMVISMCALFLFIVEVSSFIMVPPTQQIMEDIICRGQYPDHILWVPQSPDGRCKANDVQKTLAMVRSWSMSAEMFVPMLVQIPYGIVTDKYGRRPMLFISLFGCTLQMAWVIVVLQFPDTFSIWSIMYGNIAYLIGGGGQMLVAVLYTIIADVIPIAERTTVFYQLFAMSLLLRVIVNPLAALLLNLDPWIPMWLGFGSLICGLFSSLLVPETLRLRQKADDRFRHEHGASTGPIEESVAPSKRRGVLQQIFFTVRNDMSHIWRFIFGSKRIILLVAAYGFFFSVQISLSNDLLQYMTKRFDWSWSTATYVSTIGSLTSVVYLLVVMPIASWALTTKFGYDAMKRDLLLTRISVGIVAIGSFITAISAAPWQLITSLMISSLGVGFGAQCRALLNALVEPHTIATLNTTLSTAETLMMMIMSPAMGWLLARGMEIGGFWMGLPFMATFCCALIVGVAMAVFRLPKVAA